MPAIAIKMPLVRGKPTRQGNRSRRSRGQWPRQRLRSASARLIARPRPHAALPEQQDASGTSSTNAGSGYRSKEFTAQTAPRKRLKTPAQMGDAR
jgi:hypothetical protein